MPKESRERIEWCHFWWENTQDDDKPRVLLVGDSICRGYRPTVAKDLEDVANVDMMATSRAPNDPAMLKELRHMVEDYRYSVIHINNGLHAWHLDDEQYETALRAFLGQVRAVSKGAEIVWASTTPANKSAEPEKTERVRARNRVADEIMADGDIPIDDLHTLAVEKPEWRAGDGVHFTEAGYEALGHQVADCIRKHLAGRD